MDFSLKLELFGMILSNYGRAKLYYEISFVWQGHLFTSLMYNHGSVAGGSVALAPSSNHTRLLETCPHPLDFSENFSHDFVVKSFKIRWEF